LDVDVDVDLDKDKDMDLVWADKVMILYQNPGLLTRLRYLLLSEMYTETWTRVWTRMWTWTWTFTFHWFISQGEALAALNFT
jgi:hypothetical protein